VLTWSERESDKAFSYLIYRKPSFATIVKQILWADLVFENNPCIRLSWPNLFLRKPLVTGLQTWITRVSGEEKVRHKLKKGWLRFSDELIACSEAIKSKTSQRAQVIGNPYNNNIFFRKTEVEKTRDFVFLGRLVSDKGIKLAVEALKLLFNKLSANNSTLTIIGSGPELEKLEKLVKDLQLANYVFFKGSMSGEKLVNELNIYKYLLVPSLWNEPFGIVALEGLACGCIPIVSDGGGLPDAVGDAGLIFEKGNVNSLADCMVELKTNPEKEVAIRLVAGKHLKKFEVSSIAQQYLNVFESVILRRQYEKSKK
jgi:glycosyltransferase involved in cell wall biosynthesis